MTLKTIFNHDRYKIVTTFLVAIVLVFIYACSPQVRSLKDPANMVNRNELRIELDSLIATAEQRFADLDRQDEIRQTLFEHTALWASTGTINPMGLILALGALFGVGATADNIRARIEKKKTRSS